MSIGRCAHGCWPRCSRWPGSRFISLPTRLAPIWSPGAQRWLRRWCSDRWPLPSRSIARAGKSRWSLPVWWRSSWPGSPGARLLRVIAMPTRLSGWRRDWSRSRWRCRCSRPVSIACAGGRPTTARISMSGPMPSAVQARWSLPASRGCCCCCSPRCSPPSTSIWSRTSSTRAGSAGAFRARPSARRWVCCATS